MAEHRQRYNEEFKRQTVKYIQSNTKQMTQLAEELNIPVGTLKSWMAKYRSFEDEPVVTRQMLQETEQKIKDLEEENAILKKALHFFSKDQK
jgi:transposase